jgi:hypothetical protein
MKPWKGLGSACALLLLAASAGPAQAAWNNVFQVCCQSCRGQAPATSNYAAAPAVSYYTPEPACSTCPPQQTCTTRYVQRCYYQPVTTYQTKSYYEPVTTYRTSYYYEPVTSYSYSCYYDSCSCSYQQVATPVTSYRLRSQACPVQSWVQRCTQVPVTSYRVSSYWEPVTSCCQQPTCSPTSLSTPCADSAPAATQQPPAASQPSVTEQRLTPTPSVQEYPGQGQGNTGSTGGAAPQYERYYTPQPNNPQTAPKTQGAEGNTSFRRPALSTPAPLPVAPPAVRLDRVVSLPAQVQVQGQVVRQDRAPRAGARILFVSATPQGPRQNVTADSAGQFQVSLASGGWLVYVDGSDARPVFHSKIDVSAQTGAPILLMSR